VGTTKKGRNQKRMQKPFLRKKERKEKRCEGCEGGRWECCWKKIEGIRRGFKGEKPLLVLRENPGEEDCAGTTRGGLVTSHAEEKEKKILRQKA